jgi:hypothetical protein
VKVGFAFATSGRDDGDFRLQVFRFLAQSDSWWVFFDILVDEVFS